MVIPLLLGEYPKDIPFFFIQKGRKGVDHWDVQGQEGLLNFKIWKVMTSESSQKIGLGLVVFNKVYEGWAIREEFGIRLRQ